jgi:hypothetical protein
MAWIRPEPKSRAGYRKLGLPSWAVDMLRCRKQQAIPNEWGVVFTSPMDLLRATPRRIFVTCSLDWATPG